MPGAVLIQESSSSAGLGAYPGSIQLSCAYGADNMAGNIGLCFITGPLASGAIISGSSLTDTNSNNWYLATYVNSNIGTMSLWVCPWLKVSGPNTVITDGLLPVSPSGEPNMMLVELAPPPCPLGTCGFHAFNCDFNGDYHEPFLSIAARYNGGQGQWYHTLVAAIYDEFNSAEVTARTWSAVPDPMAILGGMIGQLAAPSGVNSAAMAYSIVAYPNTENSVLFIYSPGSPTLPVGSTKIIGLLISTRA